MEKKFTNQKVIKTWPQFARYVRSQGCHLLKRLDEFPGAVLITGCQRSGGTMLARIVTNSDGMESYSWGADDELDAGLVLSGYVNQSNEGRFCFQTTYLNECVHEYFEHGSQFKVIWMLRNPSSVVYSMVYNWSRFALNELFVACGEEWLTSPYKERYDKYGKFVIGRFRKACLAYCGKISQLFILIDKLGPENILVVDYDELVAKKDILLPEIYDFIELGYKPEYENAISTRSIKKSQKLSDKQRRMINVICQPSYEKARNLICEQPR